MKRLPFVNTTLPPTGTARERTYQAELEEAQAHTVLTARDRVLLTQTHSAPSRTHRPQLPISHPSMDPVTGLATATAALPLPVDESRKMRYASMFRPVLG